MCAGSQRFHRSELPRAAALSHSRRGACAGRLCRQFVGPEVMARATFCRLSGVISAMRYCVWAAVCHFTPPGMSSRRSENVNVRGAGVPISHHTQFFFALAVMPACASISATGCQVARGPSATSALGIASPLRTATKKTRGRDCGTK